MEYQVYVGSSDVQVVVEKEEDLPSHGGPYKFLKTIEINAEDGARIGADSKTIIENISSKGFHTWPEGALD